MIEPLFMRFIIDRVLLNTELDPASRLTRLHLAGARVPRRGHPLQPDRRAQGLPPAPAERAGHAVAAPVALRPAAAPAAAEAVGHEDRRHPVAPHRRRRHDDRAAADGGRVAGGLARPADHRRRRADDAELAAGADGAGHHPRRDADELRVRAPRPADLPHRPQGRRTDRRPRRRDVLRHPRRPRVRRARCASCVDYMLGRHTVLRKELFAHRRELVLWTSWGLLSAASTW